MPARETSETREPRVRNKQQRQSAITGLHESLRAPERAEMVDFSDVYPIITPQMLARHGSPHPQPLPRARERGARRASQSAPEIRGRDLVRRLWQLVSRRPHVRLRGHIWKLVPIWMVVNLALLILIVAAMIPRALPALRSATNASCAWYTVASGDTIYAISASYHLTAETVVQANHLKSYGDITAGQRLCIPLNGPLVQAAAQGQQDQVDGPNTLTNEKKTVSGEAAFIQYALPYARSAHQQTGWPVSMILAQWGLEHGWNVPGFTGYNWGNVGALPGVPHVASGGMPGAPPSFSYAPTPIDGVNYYVAVAALPFYSAVAPAARQGGPDAAARALGASPWDAGHYTSNGSPGYSLITIMQDFNLYQYDTN